MIKTFEWAIIRLKTIIIFFIKKKKSIYGTRENRTDKRVNEQ